MGYVVVIFCILLFLLWLLRCFMSGAVDKTKLPVWDNDVDLNLIVVRLFITDKVDMNTNNKVCVHTSL